MSLMPFHDSSLILGGEFWFKVITPKSETVEDRYNIKISIPDKFPRELPSVWETGKKIPKDGSYHINTDGSLCLGSPLRLLSIIYASPTIIGFAISCLEPYLCAVTMKIMHNRDFEFGELPHGNKGILEDYAHLFKLRDPDQVLASIQLLGMKKRIANKRPCPCGCNRRLGKCSLHLRLNVFRKMAPRSWFRKNALHLL